MRAANKREQPGEADAAQRRRRLAKKATSGKNAMPIVEAVDGPVQERQVDAPLVNPAPSGGILSLLHERYLVGLIVRRQIASKYANSLLGLAWSYIQPGMRFTIYLVVMGMMLGLDRGVPEFPVHLFCGLVFISFFSDAWGGGTRSIWSNRALILKMRMPREVFPISAILVAGYHVMPQIILLVIVCVIKGWSISLVGFGAFVLGLLILATFATSLALVFSALNVFYRDFQNIVGTFLQFTHFLVPMIYPFTRIANAADNHPVIYHLYMANPLAEVVLLMQRFFWWDIIPASQKDGHSLVGAAGPSFPDDLFTRGFIMLGILAVMLVLAQVFFARVQNKFPERI